MSVSTITADAQRQAAAAAIDAVNVAVGEVALALEPDDPRGPGLRMIQGGLDDLWRVTR